MNTYLVKDISIPGADESVISAQIHSHINARNLVPVTCDGEQITAYTEDVVAVYGYYYKYTFPKEGESDEEYILRKSKESPENIVWYDYKFVPPITTTSTIEDDSRHIDTIYAIIFTPSTNYINGCGYFGFDHLFKCALKNKFVSVLENSKSYRIKNPYYTDTKFKNILEIQVTGIKSIDVFKRSVISGIKKNLPYKYIKKIFDCDMSEQTYHAAINSMFEYCSYSAPSREYDWDVYELVTKGQRFLPNVANLAAKDLSMRFIQQYMRNVLIQCNRITLKSCSKARNSDAVSVKFRVKAGTDVHELLRSIELYDFFRKSHICKVYSE